MSYFPPIEFTEKKQHTWFFFVTLVINVILYAWLIAYEPKFPLLCILGLCICFVMDFLLPSWGHQSWWSCVFLVLAMMLLIKGTLLWVVLIHVVLFARAFTFSILLLSLLWARRTIKLGGLLSIWLSYFLFWVSAALLDRLTLTFLPEAFAGPAVEGGDLSMLSLWVSYQFVTGSTVGDVIPVHALSRWLLIAQGYLGMVYQFVVIAHYSNIFWSNKKVLGDNSSVISKEEESQG